MERRKFLKLAGMAGFGALPAKWRGASLSLAQASKPQMPMPGAQTAPATSAAKPAPAGKPDFSLHMGPTLVEVSPYEMVSTIGYNGQSPGPMMRLKEGARATIEFVNDTDVPELVHWHGLLVPPEVDGSTEEGTPTVAPHGMRRYSFIARPAGTRWYHTQVAAGMDLSRGLYGGQFGFVYIEPKGDPGRYDQEVFLALREWQPYFTNDPSESDDSAPPAAAGGTARTGDGLKIGYRMFSVNEHSLGQGEPIAVRPGQRVLLHMLNASATELRRMALPGHRFQVIGLDGNAVPTPQTVDVLELGPGERVDAIVEMNQPGLWTLGSTNGPDRESGLGIEVAYAGQKGEPKWFAPPPSTWDYTSFGATGAAAGAAAQPDGRLEVAIGKITGGPGKFNRWTINGKSFPQTDALKVRNGGRYRLAMKNQTDESQTMHLHRHVFELALVGGKATSGVTKDTVVVRAQDEVEVDFVANQPGPALLQSQQQDHRDNGLMVMLQYTAAPAAGAKNGATPRNTKK